MKKTEKEKMIADVFYKKRQLEQLEPYLGVSELSNSFYNKILIEKAILKKKLDDVSQSFVTKVFKKISAPKERLICDYFKENSRMI